ncbi:MoxR-like ATPase [Austwickia chelonae]|nr:MoxR-like ATPase [Austwickia chelonae]
MMNRKNSADQGRTVAQSHEISWFQKTFDALATNVAEAVLGKRHVVDLTLTCLAARGHLLLEDLPGTGKTSLARALAQSVQGEHHRIQFTADLLPGDVTGVSIFDPAKQVFEFHQGPVFSNIVLADEINRASPKTQSALLEAMGEGRVTVDGVTHEMATPFMVIATQNPIEQAGTYRLPEAQLDRFLMKTSVGYPDRAAMRQVLGGRAERDRAKSVRPVITGDVVGQLVDVAQRVYVADEIIDYVTELAEQSRVTPHVRVGMSVRGALSYVHCAKAWAASQGRNFVIPDDIKELAVPVLSHRLLLDAEAQFEGVSVEAVIDQVFEMVPVPDGGSRGSDRS